MSPFQIDLARRLIYELSATKKINTTGFRVLSHYMSETNLCRYVATSSENNLITYPTFATKLYLKKCCGNNKVDYRIIKQVNNLYG